LWSVCGGRLNTRKFIFMITRESGKPVMGWGGISISTTRNGCMRRSAIRLLMKSILEPKQSKSRSRGRGFNMRKIEIVDCMGSQSFVFPLIFQKDGGIRLKQLKCYKQGQEKQAQCTLNKPIFCPNNGETLNSPC